MVIIGQTRAGLYLISQEVIMSCEKAPAFWLIIWFLNDRCVVYLPLDGRVGKKLPTIECFVAGELKTWDPASPRSGLERRWSGGDGLCSDQSRDENGPVFLLSSNQTFCHVLSDLSAFCAFGNTHPFFHLYLVFKHKPLGSVFYEFSLCHQSELLIEPCRGITINIDFL